MTISAPQTALQALSVHLDGGLFAKAFKAVSATLGSSKSSQDTYNLVWVDMWADIGVSLTTFDDTSVSSAFISKTGREPRPDFLPDFSTTIRLSRLARFLMTDAGNSSDNALTISPHDPAQMSLPFDNVNGPAGLKLVAHMALNSVTAIESGIGTKFSSAGLLAHIEGAHAVQATSFAASKDMLSILVKISDSVGHCQCRFGEHVNQDGDHYQVATVSPVGADDLGFDFTALVSLPEAGA